MNELKYTTTTSTTATSTQQNNNNTQTNKKKPISNGITIINNNVSLSKIRKQFGQIKFEDFVIDKTSTTNTTTTTNTVDSITPITTTTTTTTTLPIKKKKSFIIKDQKDPKPTKLKKDIQLFTTIKENYLKEKQEKEKQETTDSTNENIETIDNNNNNNNNQIYYHEYINQILPNTDINNTCKELIGILRKFQEKSFATNPDKPKKRYVFGLRETLKLVESKQIRCVIITPTIEENGALNKMVEDIIRMCRSKSIQYTFALSSRSLGKLIGKTIKISVLGILDINGVNEQHQKLSLQTKQSRDEFFKLQKEFLKKQEQQQQELVKEGEIKEQVPVKEEIKEIELKVLENQSPIDKVKLMVERNENIKEYKDIENLYKQEKKQIKKEYKEKQKEFQVVREQKQELELKKELERKRLLKLKQKELKQKDTIVTTSLPKKQTTTTASTTSTKKLDASDQLLYDNTIESNKTTSTTTTSTSNKKTNNR